MTIYFPDISGYQAGIDLAGALAVAIKVTEAASYLNPYFAAQLAEAEHHGAFPIPYHFLHGGNAAGQADWCHSHAGNRPLMVDAESTSGAAGPNPRSHLARDMVHAGAVSRPGPGDIAAFTDRYRQLGGVIQLVYLPHWYWESLGSPALGPLTDRGLLLWSSAYTSYTDAASGIGWQPYGGMSPLIWQYSSTISFGGQPDVDFSAFRGSKYAGKQDDASVDACLAEFRSLAATGKWPPPPPPPGSWTYPPPVSARAKGGETSVTLSWVYGAPVPGEPAPYARVWIYKGHGACSKANQVTGYPRWPVPGTSHLFGGLDPAKTGIRDYTAHIVATAADATRARSQAYAAVQFSVSG